MNNPVEEIEPHVVLQVAAMPAVNCWVAASVTVAVAGEIEIEPVLATTETAALALLLPLVAVAVTVHVVAERGAVNRPAEDTEPQVALQVAAVLAVNCWVAPSVTLALAGEIVIEPPVEPEEAAVMAS